MIKLALIGAGNHSGINHAPALGKYAVDHPDLLELAAVCDLDRAKAESFAVEHGFKAIYTDYREMLDEEDLDGCVCVMPIPFIAELAEDMLRRKVPATVEKPMGDTLAEVDRLVATARETGTPNMVSVNRRFEPLLRKGIDWARERGPLRFVRASILRHRRQEEGFISGTAIHCIDALREIGGNISSQQLQTHEGATPWFHIDLTYNSGASATLDILPTDGSVEERYELFGDNYRVDARVGPSERPRLRCWLNGEIVLDESPPLDQPPFIRWGPYAETHEFVSALSEGRDPWPSIEEIYPSVKLSYQLDPHK